MGAGLVLCGCAQRAGACTGTDHAKAGIIMHVTYPHPGVGNVANLVSNASSLCVTSFVSVNETIRGKSINPDFYVTEPVLHEYIRHGYISALKNWDDIAASVRRSQRETLDGTPKRAMPAVWGNLWLV